MRCDAIALATTYAEAHRCLKTQGVRLVRGKRLCAHHRQAKGRSVLVSAERLDRLSSGESR